MEDVLEEPLRRFAGVSSPKPDMMRVRVKVSLKCGVKTSAQLVSFEIPCQSKFTLMAQTVSSQAKLKRRLFSKEFLIILFGFTGATFCQIVLASVLIQVSRPSVPVNLQNLVLAQVLSLLDDVFEYQNTRSQANRKRKRELAEKTRPRKKPKLRVANDPPIESGSSTRMEVDLVVPETPAILAHLTMGINEVTKHLETQVRIRRGKTTNENSFNIKVVLVCRADVNPPMLIDHLPHLVAAYNSTGASDPILLVPLPQGAEFTLAQAMGLRRVAVMAIDASPPFIFVVLHAHQRSYIG